MRRGNAVFNSPGVRAVQRWPGSRAQNPAAGRRIREVCHDLRQPVAGILALAAVALAEPGLPSPARPWLEQIVHEAESLAELIERSLDTANPAAGALRTD